MKKINYMVMGIMCSMLLVSCQQDMGTSEPVMNGMIMSDGQPDRQLMMASSNEDDILWEVSQAFNNMDAAGVFAHSTDTVRFISADGYRGPFTQAMMEEQFATLDSIHWNISAIIPVQGEGSESVSVLVDGSEEVWGKDGSYETYRLFERFVFEDGKFHTVYQWSGVIPEPDEE
ncbi:hypothetical protein AB2B38_006740 [Balneola sp. MJW-20]|uniref:hypothetical protein n=1 Tax=Gracilimonas aurantiaca TaxID=3234185 RepID=UPI00346648D8